MPLCGILNLSSGSSRSSISHCVGAFVQPPVVFFGISSRDLQWVAWIWASCNSQLPSSWIFVAALSLRHFYDAFFQQRLVHDDGVGSVCQNSFLRRGRVNSVLCIVFRSSMNLIIHLPWLLEICKLFCFVCIAVGEEDCMIFFFTFFSFCHQFSFCNGFWISCLIHIRQQSMCTLFLHFECVYSLSVSPLLCVTPSSVCVTSFVVKHHVIRQAQKNNCLRWMSSDRTNTT